MTTALRDLVKRAAVTSAISCLALAGPVCSAPVDALSIETNLPLVDTFTRQVPSTVETVTKPLSTGDATTLVGTTTESVMGTVNTLGVTDTTKNLISAVPGTDVVAAPVEAVTAPLAEALKPLAQQSPVVGIATPADPAVAGALSGSDPNSTVDPGPLPPEAAPAPGDPVVATALNSVATPAVAVATLASSPAADIPPLTTPQAVAAIGFPLLLVGVIGAYVALQARVDRSDPKLAMAPLVPPAAVTFD